ncbi:FAD:protein FMN transferase [Subtercola boreus]|uniref:FAD:protein FMN transferase n=1 Tax=Subtercola boreus TaxID=120213 RepID=A0A3E0WC06_9MICO|nr:FAD:protein FMN transferase [Subtercola boreus]RFA20615.1 hypothetical protein B7R24_09295 [Subtercola boreus]RFA20729.1 hypothetical protein B7R23_09230 [Subtercola boreus]RFA26940.1 hypothetical protein B7R25_09360 [Subtercola boreus]
MTLEAPAPPAAAAGAAAPPAAAREWAVWSTTARVVVTDPRSLDAASAILAGVLDEVERACSRFTGTSELALLQPRLAGGAEVSPLLATLVRVALEAARLTQGAVDPTLGNALARLGYDRTFEALPSGRSSGAADGDTDTDTDPDPVATTSPSASVVTLSTSIPGWRRVGMVSPGSDRSTNILTVPADLALDLGATAKAYAADLAAARIVAALGGGALVALGGDIATAGTAPRIDRPAGPFPAPATRVDSPPPTGWQISVQDLPGDPSCQVTLAAGQALATSSTQKRRWRQHGQTVHHILDPARGLPADPVWRTVTVAATDCVSANTLSTASVVRGRASIEWLARRGVPARLVSGAGRVLTLGGWPDENSVHVRAAR